MNTRHRQTRRPRRLGTGLGPHSKSSHNQNKHHNFEGLRRRRKIAPRAFMADKITEGCLLLPRNYIDFLFPYLDSKTGVKKASTVLIALMRFANHSSRNLSARDPSQPLSEIARMAALTEKSLQRTLSKLEDIGLVKIIRTEGLLNRYEIQEDKMNRLTAKIMAYHGCQVIF